MARLPALIRAIAQHDRRGEKTIAHIARQVRDAGLIASTKRGVGASVMSFADAATLLLAVCGDNSPQGAVTAVHNLRALQPLPWDDNDRMKREDLAEPLWFLRESMGFAGAVERLIEHAPAVARWQANYRGKERRRDGMSEAEYSAFRMNEKLAAITSSGAPGYGRLVRVISYVPGTAAELHLGSPWLGLEEDDAFHEYYAPHGRAESDSSDMAATSDCLISVEVGLPILLALHAAVVDEA